MKLKTIALGLAAAFALHAQAKDYKYESVEGDLLGARIYTLPNGLKVYLSVNKEKPRIQTYIAVRTGSRNDPAETTGLAHYLEHLMFKGTTHFGTTDYVREKPLLDTLEARFEQYRRLTDPQQRRAAYHEIDSISQVAAQYNIPNEYDKLMSSIGAQGTNAYTSNDETVYTEDIPANEVDTWANVQGERFQDMVIRGFHTELEAVYEEYNIGIAQDSRKMWKAYFAKLYPGHPYGTQSTIGTQEHLKNPSITNIKEYFRRYYVPNNVAICMAGDMDPDRVIATIDKYFGGWKPNPTLSYPQYAPIPDLSAPTDTTVYGKEAEQVWLGWKFAGASSAQADTLDVIGNLLSNGTAGLYDLNVNQPMKCLGIAAGAMTQREYSSFIVQGRPQEGQSLDEVKALALGEIERLKRGDFSDDLLPSVVSNMKLDYYNSMENNANRADQMVSAFVNGQDWASVAGRLGRIAGMTKQEIVAFANRHFGDNYAVVYKRTGDDTTLVKIDKPEITGIPANRDQQSRFVTDVVAHKSEPIQPRFLDFKRDLSQGKTKQGLPVLYVKNTTNGIFSLTYYYKFGTEANKWLPYAASYFDYLGTAKLTATQLKQQFYKLACSMRIGTSNDAMSISLTGLGENMGEAVKLMEDFLANAKADREAYDKYVATVEKSRKDRKLRQASVNSALRQYAIYGPYNALRNVPDSAELRTEDPQRLVDMVKALRGYDHTILYYGPQTLEEVAKVVSRSHKTAKKLAAVPMGKPYTEQPTPRNEVVMAPYEAKNIYMVQYHNEGKTWSADRLPIVTLFNEYFGGSMNSVVFQEMRESRALAYSAGAYYTTPWRKQGTEAAYASVITQNDKMVDCIRTFNAIIDTIPQSPAAFELAKQSALKQLATARTTKDDIIYAYLNAQRLGIDYDTNEHIFKALPSLTLDDVVRFERQEMARKPYRYVILGDEKELDMPSLEQIAPVQRLTLKEIFGY